MYQQTRKLDAMGVIVGVGNSVMRFTDNACIPFDPANTDYQQFVVYLNEGGALEDPDGNAMTPEQIQEFMKTLPTWESH